MKVAFEPVPSDFVSATGFYDYKEPVSEALATIRKNGAVVVTKDGEYYGIVDTRMVVRSGVRIGKSHAISKFAVKVPVLDSSTSIEKAIHQFYSSGAKALPYYEGKRIAGIVKRSMMLKAILSLHLLSKYKVRELMSTPIMAVESDISVSNARAIMKGNRLNHLVIMSEGKVGGILTYKDILGGTGQLAGRPPELQGDSKRDITVKDVAEANVRSVEQEEPIDAAIRSIIENKVSSLLVTRAGKPVGMVTVHDIFAAIANSAAGAEDNITISGLDDYTQEFHDEILAELEKLDDRINKFHKMDVAGINLLVKRHRAKNYEMKLRVWLAKRGAVSTTVTGFSLDATLEDAIANVYKRIKGKKEVVYMERRDQERVYNDEE